jgi:hypothetical protein
LNKARKRNSDEKLSELKYRILDCALCLETIQQTRLGVDSKNRVRNYSQISQKISQSLGLNAQSAERFLLHRECVMVTLLKYSRAIKYDNNLYNSHALLKILTSIFKGTPIKISQTIQAVNLFPSMDQLLALKKAQETWENEMIDKSFLKLKSNYENILAILGVSDKDRQNNFTNDEIKLLQAVDTLLRQTLPQLFYSLQKIFDSRDTISQQYRLHQTVYELINRLILHITKKQYPKGLSNGGGYVIPVDNQTGIIRALAYLPLQRKGYYYHELHKEKLYGYTYYLTEMNNKQAKEIYNILENRKHKFWVYLTRAVGQDRQIMQDLAKLKDAAEVYCTLSFAQRHNFDMQNQLRQVSQENNHYREEGMKLEKQYTKLCNEFKNNLEALKSEKSKIQHLSCNIKELKKLIQSNKENYQEKINALLKNQNNNSITHSHEIKKINANKDKAIEELKSENSSLHDIIKNLTGQHKTLEENIQVLKNTLKKQDAQIQHLIQLVNETNQHSLQAFLSLEKEATNILSEFCNTKDSSNITEFQKNWGMPSHQKSFDYQRKLHRVKNRVHENLGRDKNEQEKIQNFLNKFRQFAQYVENTSKEMRQSITQSMQKKESLVKELKQSRVSIENKFNAMEAVIYSQKTTINSLEKMNHILLKRIKYQEALINALDIENEKLIQKIQDKDNAHQLELKQLHQQLINKKISIINEEKQKSITQADENKQLKKKLKDTEQQLKQTQNLLSHTQQTDKKNFLKKAAPNFGILICGVSGGYLTSRIKHSVTQGTTGIGLVMLAALLFTYVVKQAGKRRDNHRFFRRHSSQHDSLALKYEQSQRTINYAHEVL